jgi:hypothetical protein
MMDAYTHLDTSAADPVGDFRAKMISAGIDRALAVETWKGNNYATLERLIGSKPPDFRVALCFRPEQGWPTPDVIGKDMVAGLRVKTADLRRLGSMAGRLESSEKWLVTHAESGIGRLTEEIALLVKSHPRLRIYLPHCGWPRQTLQRDGAWNEAVVELSRLPNLVVGVSALAHFSTKPFPHPDVMPFVRRLTELFPSSSIVAGSDYPLCEQSQYSAYMKLARSWIEGEDDRWSPVFESLLFGARNAAND